MGFTPDNFADATLSIYLGPALRVAGRNEASVGFHVLPRGALGCDMAGVQFGDLPARGQPTLPTSPHM